MKGQFQAIDSCHCLRTKAPHTYLIQGIQKDKGRGGGEERRKGEREGREGKKRKEGKGRETVSKPSE